MDCPVCGSADATPFARCWDGECFTTGDERYDYRRCEACDAVFIDPPPISRLGQIYPDDYYSVDGGGGGVIQSIKEWLDQRHFRKLIDSLPGDELAVLDVGGGSGWLLTLVKRASPRVVATHEVDFQESCREAAEAAGHVYHCTPVDGFEPPRQFHLILMLNLIEHVADPRGVLEKMYEALAPGGMVLIKTPNWDTWDRRLFHDTNWGGFHCPRHWVLFTRPGLLRVADECGLECVSAQYTQGGPQWASSVLQWFHQRGWIQLSAKHPVYFHPLFLPLAALFAAVDFVRRPFAPTAQMFVTLRRPAATRETSSSPHPLSPIIDGD